MNKNPKYVSSVALAEAIVEDWVDFINKSKIDGLFSLLMDNKIYYPYVLDGTGCVIEACFDREHSNIILSLINKEDSLIQVYYKIVLYDNTKRSVAFAIDSVIDYAVNIMLCTTNTDRGEDNGE